MSHQKASTIGLSTFIERFDSRIEILDRNIKRRIDLMVGQKHVLTGLDKGEIIQREFNHGCMVLTPIIKKETNA